MSEYDVAFGFFITVCVLLLLVWMKNVWRDGDDGFGTGGGVA